MQAGQQPGRLSGDHHAQTRFSRRQLLGGCAAAALGLGLLEACGPVAARPTIAAANPVLLTWRPWQNFPANVNLHTAMDLMYEATAPLRVRTPITKAVLRTAPAKASAEWNAAWSPTDLYVWCHVHLGRPVIDTNTSIPYEDDAVEIYLDGSSNYG